MNFILYNSLGGGGIASLRSDPQVCCVCINVNEQYTLPEFLTQDA